MRNIDREDRVTGVYEGHTFVGKVFMVYIDPDTARPKAIVNLDMPLPDKITSLSVDVSKLERVEQ